MGRTRKSQNSSLGKSLVKKNKTGWDASKKEDHHHAYNTSAEDKTKILKSVTEESSYEEFIATASLAAKDFTAEKLNIKFVSLSTATTDDDSGNYLTDAERKQVSVPRRPKWTTEMSAEELNDLENEAFLQWRRHMAQLQEKDGITPFERNVEVWRQLWRVVERADIVVQIVDARNPLMYRCEDLESYVKELGKIPVLLINKADFLTDNQRKLWSQYFNSINLSHAFYSAEAAKSTKEVIEEKEEGSSSSTGSGISEDEEESSSDESADEEVEDVEKKGVTSPSTNPSSTSIGAQQDFQKELKGIEVLNRAQLIEYLKSFKKVQKADTDETAEFNIGLVGYPNVGKSSTINSIMALKKTSVSSTPGKTKHFQTLILEDDVILCDCPGLVMPAFGGSKGEMVLGGILPIDQLTEYNQSMMLLAKRIPRPVLQFKYGITLPEEFDHNELLSSYAAIRGFMTVRGLPDNSRAARIMLKDYVNGKLLYNHAPPNIPQEEFQPSTLAENLIRNFISADTKKEIHFTSTEEQSKLLKLPRNPKASMEGRLDNQFFNPMSSTAHVKGRQHIPSGLTSASSSSTGLSDKPWRKHNNKNKREKLRRVYHHLDVE